jgi:hypothetical protein
MVLFERRILMNEGLALYLNIDPVREEENETLIQKIDDLLLQAGVKYSGFQNLYVPIHAAERDKAIYQATRLLHHTEWLSGILSHILISNELISCPLDQLLADKMSTPSQGKLDYYEQYYLTSHKLAHPIVVDENKQIRDGYVSYLLALKYNLRPEVFEAFSEQPLKKIVTGRHVRYVNGEWNYKTDRHYRWSCNLKKPVVPGDILQVHTQKGLAYMCVEKIDYVTGEEFCKEYNSVKRHMHARIDRK